MSDIAVIRFRGAADDTHYGFTCDEVIVERAMLVFMLERERK
jgi:hypothetical protein